MFPLLIARWRDGIPDDRAAYFGFAFGIKHWSVKWSSGNVFVFGARSRKFKFRGGQIEHSVANGSEL